MWQVNQEKVVKDVFVTSGHYSNRKLNNISYFQTIAKNSQFLPKSSQAVTETENEITQTGIRLFYKEIVLCFCNFFSGH